MKINNIEEIKKLNIICTNAEETKDCFSILDKLGLYIYENNEHDNSNLICRMGTFDYKFTSTSEPKKDCQNISFYNFKQQTKKFLNKDEIDEKELIKYIKNNKIAIHCPTKEDYNRLTEMLERNGEKWGNGKRFGELVEFNVFRDNHINYSILGNFVYCQIHCEPSIVIITVQELFDKFKIEKKEEPEVEDIEYDKNSGRVLKINNHCFKESLFVIGSTDIPMEFSNCSQKVWNEYINLGILYISKEACEKAEERMKIETQLRNIALRLNDGKEIDWNDFKLVKYYIFYDYEDKFFRSTTHKFCRNQGTIYCLSKDFLKVAREEIGEERLIDYLKNC